MQYQRPVETGGYKAAASQIFAEADLLPIDDVSEKNNKKNKTYIKFFKNYW